MSDWRKLNPLFRAIRAFRDEWLAARLERQIATQMTRAKLEPWTDTTKAPSTSTERTKTEHRRIDITREDE